MLEGLRGSDKRGDAVAPKQTLEEHELWIEILRLRVRIDNGNGSERGVAPLPAPLLAEALEEGGTDILTLNLPRENAFDRRAAYLLRARHESVDQRASGIRVDLDELSAAWR